MRSLYSQAIKNKDIQGLSNIFYSELNKFIINESSVYHDWLKADEADTKRCNHLKVLYYQTWDDFLHSVPFKLMLKYGEIRLSDIINQERINPYDVKLCNKVIDLIVRYTTYIISNTIGNLLTEYVTFQSLALTFKMIDVTRMTVSPLSVTNKVKQVFQEIAKETFTKPQACCLYQGRFYPYRLSSSAKACIIRQQAAREVLEELVVMYRNKYRRMPTYTEARDYLVACSSQDSRLHLLSKHGSINVKTFRKYAKGFRFLRSRRT